MAKLRIGALLSGVSLYAFCRGWLLGVAVVAEPLFELLRNYPRLTALASLGLWLSPIVLIAIGHSLLSATLDRFDAHKGERAERRSAWVGVYSWLVALFATVTSFFVVAVIEPRPPEPDMGMLGQLAASMSPAGVSLAVHSAVWIVLAALLYHAEQRGRRRSRA